MRMNAGIILAGQGPDILGNMARGQQAAQAQNDASHTNAFRAMLQQQGPGIMQGQENALASLAQFDPQAALGVQSTRQTMRIQEQQARQSYEAARRAAAAWAQSQDEATRAQTAAQVERALAMGTQAQTPEQWDQVMQQFAPQYAGQFDNRQMIIAGALGLADALRMGQGGQGFRAATPEEAARFGAAGGQFGPDGRFYPINPPSGMTVETTPEGGVRLVQGAGVGREAAAERAAATQTNQARIVMQDIDRALELTQGAIVPTTGAVGRIASGIPGTAASDVSSLLDTIGANIAFDTLANMRASSPTGAGLGSITERELALLQATRGSLAQSQTQEQFVRNLQRLREQFSAIVEGAPPPGIAAPRWQAMTGEQRAQVLAAQQGQDPAAPQAAPAAPRQSGPVTPEAIMQMPEEDLLQLDVLSLDAAGLAAMERRLGMGQ